MGWKLIFRVPWKRDVVYEDLDVVDAMRESGKLLDPFCGHQYRKSG